MTSALPNGVTALSHLGVIRAEGADAANFLHGQLTQDFALLKPGEARLAALCTAKGRMIASFIGVRPRPDLVLLVCSRDILAATLKRLSMYVLRAKVKLTDASESIALFGLTGTALAANEIDAAAAPGLRIARPVPGSEEEVGIVPLYPADGVPRALWMGPADATRPVGGDVDLAIWQWSEVRSGVATLTTPVLDAFVPQMLNYESIGGVNFKKGCYPGQEVVARSQFRGTLKRRAYVATADAPVEAGQEVFAAGDAEQPVGTVVQAASAPDGRWAALVSMQIAALDAGPLHAGSATGPTLQVEPLPYPLLADI
ncbi:YgfZ/GcvT domain-containing protein [Variovorax guangxiensis]|uniref:Folate-binding protein n=1 Tax=Variovorax guangxiensis TaxID=1775474 RepID=A0A502DYH1_9BURK|nr:folate-binding protein YgfZ [Variovorax guangxiensis]RZI69763.1 MAG: folate-binding protein [Variovorax sp.]TPG26828.1 folate-binding protein [Variovorax ginsengisoli]TPG30555.1 folate-binding protein [Variovorax guangxiensis]